MAYGSEVFVAKFGGTSLADANQIRKVLKIIRDNPARRFIVVSAPGKRGPDDRKITDDLITLRSVRGDQNANIALAGSIRSRFCGIARELGLELELNDDLAFLGRPLDHQEDMVKSRGEYVIAKIVAKALEPEGYVFVDAADIIKFKDDGTLDIEETMKSRDMLLSHKGGYVIPGFYGAMPNGDIKTFSRGGSDLSGAIIAAVVGADLYENWTDVSGFRMTDPCIVPDAKRVDVVTYSELRELTYMGANVLHDAVVFPLRNAGIPVLLTNTNRPNEQGTLIVPDDQAPEDRRPGSVVGISGRRGFTFFKLSKSMMNEEVGFIHRVTGVFFKHGVSIEHMPSGIDTMSVVVANENLDGRLRSLADDLALLCDPDFTVSLHSGIALICTVGNSMAHMPGVAGKLMKAVGDAGVSIRMIDQGSSELNIIIGVSEDDYEKAVRAIYSAFVHD